MNDVTITQDEDLSEFENWAQEFNQTDADMIPIHVVATWTLSHVNGRHSHITKVGYPDTDECDYYEHNEDDGDWLCGSFEEALRYAVEYITRPQAGL